MGDLMSEQEHPSDRVDDVVRYLEGGMRCAKATSNSFPAALRWSLVQQIHTSSLQPFELSPFITGDPFFQANGFPHPDTETRS
jgi:hypothetical protein